MLSICNGRSFLKLQRKIIVASKVCLGAGARPDGGSSRHKDHYLSVTLSLSWNFRNILRGLGVHGFFSKSSPLPMYVLELQMTTGMHTLHIDFHSLSILCFTGRLSVPHRQRTCLACSLLHRQRESCESNQYFSRGTGFQELRLLLL